MYKYTWIRDSFFGICFKLIRKSKSKKQKFLQKFPAIKSHYITKLYWTTVPPKNKTEQTIKSYKSLNTFFSFWTFAINIIITHTKKKFWKQKVVTLNLSKMFSSFQHFFLPQTSTKPRYIDVKVEHYACHGFRQRKQEDYL